MIILHLEREVISLIEVRKKEHERFDVLLRHFNRAVQQSGLFTEIKKRRYRSEEPSRTQRRMSAIRKTERRSVKRGY
jgi:ribosomal protein S21